MFAVFSQSEDNELRKICKETGFRRKKRIRENRILTYFSQCCIIIPSMRENDPYSEFFWSAFSRIWTEFGEILDISPYSVRMREITDQKSSEYGHFSHSG